MHARSHARSQAHTHTHARIRMHVRTHVCTHAHTCARMHAHTHARMLARTHVRMNACVYACMNARFSLVWSARSCPASAPIFSSRATSSRKASSRSTMLAVGCGTSDGDQQCELLSPRCKDFGCASTRGQKVNMQLDSILLETHSDFRAKYKSDSTKTREKRNSIGASFAHNHSYSHFRILEWNT